MDILLILALNAVSITLVIFAGLICLRQKEGWGVFLFVAVLTFTGSSALQTLAPNAPAQAPVATNQ